MIPLKSEKDLEMLREAGRILAGIMQKLQGRVKAGVSTQALDQMVEELARQENAVAAFKDYKGFPANICTSVNEEVVHGIPGERQLEEGDIISIDLGINYQGYFADAAVTVPVGKINPRLKKLIHTAKEALAQGIKQVKSDNHLSDVSCAIQNYVEAQGFSVVREFVGHGIGQALHEEPEIPNFGAGGQGPLLKSGMVLAIEPMVNMGSWQTRILENGWTAVTKDGQPSAHFEHTVAITQKGAEILTRA